MCEPTKDGLFIWKDRQVSLGRQYGLYLYVDIPVITNDNLQEWIEKINYEDGKYIEGELREPEEIKERWFLD